VAFLTRGDRQAFSVIYNAYSSALYGVIARIITNEEAAADLLQEAFIKIWNSRANYDPSRGRLFTWLLNIARNTAIDTTRSKQYKAGQKIQPIDNSVKQVNRSSRIAVNYDSIGLKETVAKLKPELRQIIDLLYFGGYTQEEAAKELNMPLGTVKTRARNALIQLRELMDIQKDER